jgi:hypothetical protein
METIRAIETRYDGCRFRSRQEARWAVFLNHLKIPWRYEPEGFDLGEAGLYLPDFLVYPNTDRAFWFEVKGQSPSSEERKKTSALSVATGLPSYLYFAEVQVPASQDLQQMTSWREYYPAGEMDWVWMGERGWQWVEGHPGAVPAKWELVHQIVGTAYKFNQDGSGRYEASPWWWTECPHCGRVVLKLHGQVGACPIHPDAEITYPQFAHATPRLQAAYKAAKSARFEHGEKG